MQHANRNSKFVVHRNGDALFLPIWETFNRLPHWMSGLERSVTDEKDAVRASYVVKDIGIVCVNFFCPWRCELAWDVDRVHR